MNAEGNMPVELMVFSKYLAGPTLAEVARRLRAMDIDAIDLTVRPGGHVTPERVDLPRAAAGARGHAGRHDHRERHRRPRARHGAPPAHRRAPRHPPYKLGYYPYRGFGTLRQQRATR